MCHCDVMSQMDDLRHALCHDETPSRRQMRAARTRAEALAPGRILMSLLTLPVLALGVALSIYMKTSEYDPPDALAHLVALAGCDAAQSIGLAPSYRGGLGYHAKNDSDGNGVACEVTAGFDAGPVQTGPVQDVAFSEPVVKRGNSARIVGGAKFLTP